jgi:AmiR/NasT family two-component response regulator
MFHEPVSNDSYRSIVHQAAGMVSEQCVCSIDEAFGRIAQFAGNRGQSVDEVSAQIVSRDLRFDP